MRNRSASLHLCLLLLAAIMSAGCTGLPDSSDDNHQTDTNGTEGRSEEVRSVLLQGDEIPPGLHECNPGEEAKQRFRIDTNPGELNRSDETEGPDASWLQLLTRDHAGDCEAHDHIVITSISAWHDNATYEQTIQDSRANLDQQQEQDDREICEEIQMLHGGNQIVLTFAIPLPFDDDKEKLHKDALREDFQDVKAALETKYAGFERYCD